MAKIKYKKIIAIIVFIAIFNLCVFKSRVYATDIISGIITGGTMESNEFVDAAIGGAMHNDEIRDTVGDAISGAIGGATGMGNEDTRDRINDAVDGALDDVVGEDSETEARREQGVEGLLGDPTAADAHHTIGEITGEAQSFISTGNAQSVGFNENNLQNGSNTLFNILLGIGLAAAVIIGAYLGVKFMLASAEDKAKVKESLVPYFAGCIIIFGAFTIWKLAVVLLSGLE